MSFISKKFLVLARERRSAVLLEERRLIIREA
jgi:hypothetical protein